MFKLATLVSLIAGHLVAGSQLAYRNFEAIVSTTVNMAAQGVEIDKNSGSIFINSPGTPYNTITTTSITSAPTTTTLSSYTGSHSSMTAVYYGRDHYLAVFSKTDLQANLRLAQVMSSAGSLVLTKIPADSIGWLFAPSGPTGPLVFDAAVSSDFKYAAMIASEALPLNEFKLMVVDCTSTPCQQSYILTMTSPNSLTTAKMITPVDTGASSSPYYFAVTGTGSSTVFLILTGIPIYDYAVQMFTISIPQKLEAIAVLSEPGKHIEAFGGLTSLDYGIQVHNVNLLPSAGECTSSLANSVTFTSAEPLVAMAYLDKVDMNYLLVVFTMSIKIYHKETLQEISQQNMIQFKTTLPTGSYMPSLPNAWPSFAYTDTYSYNWYALIVNIGGVVSGNIITGGDTSVKIVKFNSWECVVGNCIECPKDFAASKCDKCDQSASLPYLVKDSLDTCSKSIPAGYGPDTSAASPMTVHKCITANCADCSANKNLCTICNNGFVQNGTECKTLPTIGTSTTNITSTVLNKTDALPDLKLASAAYTTKNTVATLVFSHDLRPSTIRASLLITVRDLTAARVLPCDECSLAFKGRVLEVTVPLKEQVTKGVLVIEISGAGKVSGEAPLKSAQGQVFVDYPIEVTGLVLISGGASQTAKSTGEAISAASSNIRAIANLAVSGANPGSAMALDKVLSEFFFLRFLEGPQIIYPTLVLTYASSPGSLPFSVGNPFADWAHNQVCPVPQVYAENDVSCNMLESYGEDVAINFAILMLTLSISLGFMFLCFKWKKPQTEDSPAELVDLDPEDREELPFIKRTIRGSGLNYGLKFFMAKIESTSLEICVYCAVTLTSDDYSTPMMAGKVVAGVVILLLATYSIFMVILGIKIKKQLEIYNKAKEAMEAKQSQENGDDEEKAADKKVDPKEASKKQQKIELGDVIRLDESKLWLFIAPFEEMAVPKRTWYLFAPVVTIIRNIALGFIVLKLNGKGYAQLSTISGIMLAHFCFTVTSNVKFSRYENIKEGLDLGFNFIYVTLKLASYSNISEYQRQTILGGIMAISLVLIIVNSIIYMVVLTIMAVIDLIKALRNFCKDKDGKMKKKSKKQGQKDQSIDNSQVESIMPMSDKNSIVQNPASIVRTKKADNLFGQKPIQKSINQVTPINAKMLENQVKANIESPKEVSVAPTGNSRGSSKPRKIKSHQIGDNKHGINQHDREMHEKVRNYEIEPNGSQNGFSQKRNPLKTQKKAPMLNNSHQLNSKKMQARTPDPSQSDMEPIPRAAFSNLHPQTGLRDQYADQYI